MAYCDRCNNKPCQCPEEIVGELRKELDEAEGLLLECLKDFNDKNSLHLRMQIQKFLCF